MGLNLSDAREIILTMQRIEGIAQNTAAILLLVTDQREEMATFAETLSALSARVDAQGEDVVRVLAQVTELVAEIRSGDVPLSPELQAKADDIAARLDALNAQMDAAVPPATPEPEPAPEGDTVL